MHSCMVSPIWTTRSKEQEIGEPGPGSNIMSPANRSNDSMKEDIQEYQRADK